MREADYWRKRFEELEEAASRRSEKDAAMMAREYEAAKRQVKRELAVFYSRLAANNGLATVAEARRLLTADELADFRMTLEQYIALAKANGVAGDFTQMLENASLKYRISRLEAIRLQLEAQASILLGKQSGMMGNMLARAYEEAYYGAAFEIAKGTGVGRTLFRISDRRLKAVTRRPWAADGLDFSKRIWGQHRPQLVQSLHRELSMSLATGAGPDKAIESISRQFDVSGSSAQRLVQTEEAFFSSEAQHDVFRELDVERFQVVATLDTHTSDICQGLDGQVFKMSEYEVGVTAPPFHPRCRTTTAPYFEDEVSTRAARDPDSGKTMRVPSDMTYKEWRAQFLKDEEGNR